MQRQAEEYLAAAPDYPGDLYRGRGVVIAGGGARFFPSIYVTVRALRHFGCRLPIQVWYLGRKREMPAQRQAILAAFGVECVDADRVRRSHPARRLDGWELKVFAALHCPFEELLLLDADCYPCRNPDFLFALEDYRTLGAIFWPDMPVFDPRLKWSAFGVPDPRRGGSVESGQFVINKRLCWQPLNLAWFYNDHSDYYYRYGFGDKHTFEVAWARCGQPFVMWEPKAHGVDVAYLHRGPDHLPLFVHRCCDKFRFDNHKYSTKQRHALPSFYSSLPLERECWSWMSELAHLTGRRIAELGPRVRFHPAKRGQTNHVRFAIATLYTPDVAYLGDQTSRIMRAYASRHGYDAIVAKERIDASRPAPWSKLLLVDRYLTQNPSCDWLMWIDHDAVVTNPTRRLEDLVDETVDFVVPEDIPSRWIKSGVFLLRNCPAALDMLRRAYAKVQYVHHPAQERPALFDALIECADVLRTRIVSRKLLASLADEHEAGDFIIHFAGWSTEAKLAGVKKVIASAAKPSRRSYAPPLLPAPLPVHELLPPNPPASRKSSRTRPSIALPPIYCITCRQTPERTRLAKEHFSARRLNVQFFPGIHGKTFGLPACGSNGMSAGEVGCLLSHYMLWQTLAYLPHEEVLILEDDAWFETDFPSRFRRAYRDLPEDWQFVFVGAVALEGKPIERLTDRVGVMRYPCGTHAYLVKRSVLPFLLQTNHQALMPIDLQLMANSLPAMKCYMFVPTLVKQRSTAAPVDCTGENWPTTTRAVR